MKSKIRKQESGFTIVNNELINDPDLHSKSKYIYIWMLSKPDDFEFWQNTILKACNIGDSKTLSKYVKPLIEKGWIHREQRRAEQARFASYEYFINRHKAGREFLPPGDDSPEGNFTGPEKDRTGEKPPILNKDLLTNKDLEKKKEGEPPSKNEVFLYVRPLIAEYCKKDGQAIRNWAIWETNEIFEHYGTEEWRTNRNKKVKSWTQVCGKWIRTSATRNLYRNYPPNDERHGQYDKKEENDGQIDLTRYEDDSSIKDLSNKLKV